MSTLSRKPRSKSSVYALGDPRTGEIRYIGIANDVYSRYAQHLNHPHLNKEKNTWMEDIKAAGIVPTLTILEPDVSVDMIYEREKYWIQHYQALGASLTNIIHGKPATKDDNSLSVQQVCERFRFSERTVFNLIKRGDLKGFKAGRSWRFEESDIDDYILKQRAKVRGEQPAA
jgi:excisionase family DNA binding protein